MRTFRMIAYSLVIVGALVWGLVGMFNYNLVASIFGDGSILSRIIYSLVGLSAIGLLVTEHKNECCECSDIHY